MSGGSVGVATTGQQVIEPWIDVTRIAFENLVSIILAQIGDLVEVALGIVECVSRFGIDPGNRTQHFRCEQDIVDRHDPAHQLDSGVVIDASVEEDVAQQMVEQGLLPDRQTESAKAAPVEWDRATTMRNHELERRKVLEEIALYQLHERRRIGIEVVRPRVVKGRIAR